MTRRQTLTIDAHLDERPGIPEVGPLAAWLHVSAMLYARRNLTDGFVPREMVERLVNWSGTRMLRRDMGGPTAEVYTAVDPFLLAVQLCRVGLWRRLGNHGFAIVGYLLHNPARDEEQSEKSAWKAYVATRKRQMRQQEARDMAEVAELEEANPHDKTENRHDDRVADPVSLLYAKGPSPGGPGPVVSGSRSSSYVTSVATEDDEDPSPPPTAPPSQTPPILSAMYDEAKSAIQSAAVAEPEDAAAPTVTAAAPHPRKPTSEKNLVARFLDAVRELDPTCKILTNGRSVGAINAAKNVGGIEPEYLAAAYVAARQGKWGDDWLRANMSVWSVADRIDAYALWLEHRDEAQPASRSEPDLPRSAAQSAARRRFDGGGDAGS